MKLQKEQVVKENWVLIRLQVNQLLQEWDVMAQWCKWVYADEEEKPHFAGLKRDQSIETITLEEALDLFKLPLTLGEYEGEEVYVNAGRFGPYVKFGEAFYFYSKR